MMRIRLVLPACVAPSSTVTSPLRGATLMSYSHCSAPTFLLIWSRDSCITPLPCPAWAEIGPAHLGRGLRQAKNLKTVNKKKLSLERMAETLLKFGFFLFFFFHDCLIYLFSLICFLLFRYKVSSSPILKSF
jgi:hypothetical protein